MATSGLIATILKTRGKELHAEWLLGMAAAGSASAQGRITQDELEQQSRQFLQLLAGATQGDRAADPSAPESQALHKFLGDLSRSRVTQGFSSSETASFIFSFKRPLFDALRTAAGKDADLLARETWAATELLDALGLQTVTNFQKAREDLISRQQRTCWSCRHRWSSCGRAFWRCR